MRLLVIEDDEDTATYIRRGLLQAGHTVDVVANGKDGVTLVLQEDFDMLILDRMLPGLDGLSVAKTLRGAGSKTPILFLTALGGVNDRVQGLDAGGDDYLVKPFAMSELLARINALARRPPMRDDDEILRAGPLEMDVAKRFVSRDGERIDLQAREFVLLEILLRNKGRVVTRNMLLERVWGFHFEPKSSIVETHISRLRTKIDRPFDKQLIQTVRGSGYLIQDGA
jgi:two-component system OmpR family response regulator